MDTGSNQSHGYRITVRGELTQAFVEPLEQTFVESTGDAAILVCAVVDQAKLQAILNWLYVRGVEIVSVIPDDGDAESMDAPMVAE